MRNPDAFCPPGRKVKLSNLVGDRTVVLFFYPQDDTPGCTKEALGFRDRIQEFRELGAEVLVDRIEHLLYLSNPLWHDILPKGS